MRALLNPGWTSVFALAIAVPSPLVCRSHSQADGTYAFTSSSVQRDDCGLLADGGALGEGTMRFTGDDTQMTFGPDAIHLAGQFQDHAETFFLDGDAAKVTKPVQGRACLLDLMSLHVEGTTDSETAFHGTLRLQYDVDAPSSCVCKLWTSYTALRQ